ncbi:hypothetical protein YB2330_001968 [Saitoella coloradoensis]
MISQDHKAAVTQDDGILGFINDIVGAEDTNEVETVDPSAIMAARAEIDIAVEDTVRDTQEVQIALVNNGLVHYGSSDEESEIEDEVDAMKETTAVEKKTTRIREKVVEEEIGKTGEAAKEEEELIIGSERKIAHVVTPRPTLPSPPISPSTERNILENVELSDNQKCAALDALMVERERERKERAEAMSGLADISGAVGGHGNQIKSVREELDEINKTAKNDEERRVRIRESARKRASTAQDMGHGTTVQPEHDMPEDWRIYVTPSDASTIKDRKLENTAKLAEVNRLPEFRFTQDEKKKMFGILKKNIALARRGRIEAKVSSGVKSQMSEAEVKKETVVHLMEKVPLPGEETRLFNREEPSAEAESEQKSPSPIIKKEIVIDSSDDEKLATATKERPDDTTKKRVRVVPATKKPQPESVAARIPLLF